MLSRAQQILIKRAQAEAGLSDPDYREAIATVSGWADCRSSKDRRLTDRHVDLLLSYFEAVFWMAVDAGQLQPSCNPRAVFKQRCYWAGKNQRGNTSRDRHVERAMTAECLRLENDLAALGYGLSYFQGIQARIVPWSLPVYRAALQRTLVSKRGNYLILPLE